METVFRYRPVALRVYPSGGSFPRHTHSQQRKAVTEKRIPMSERNGDKSRFGIARKKGIVRRERSRELRKTLEAAAAAAAKPALADSKA
jgi:hypothetical protein